MPAVNGTTPAEVLDYKTALEVLKNDYTEYDGIDVHTLVDSKRNGGLTYNDFLVLPGYIGMLSCRATSAVLAPDHSIPRLPRFRSRP